jgi:hypothetical protein
MVCDATRARDVRPHFPDARATRDNSVATA